uniref:3-dehydroquinate synthase n=1 Tax=Solanum tuberosum TaxID=4113 RepID=M1AJ13_SOLTU
MDMLLPSLSLSYPKVAGKWQNCRKFLGTNRVAKMCAFTPSNSKKKTVWIWTENKQVMTAAVERGWNTFIFPSNRQDLALEWSSIAVIYPLFVEEGRQIDHEHKSVAAFAEISSPQQLEQFQISEEQADKVVVNLLDWQVIPAENIVADFQGTQTTVLVVSKTQSEAQVFLEALEHGLGGVVMKVEDVGAILELKGYFDRRRDVDSLLNLTKAIISHIQVTGMGDRVCVDICSLMRPGEGLLVCSFCPVYFCLSTICK